MKKALLAGIVMVFVLIGLGMYRRMDINTQYSRCVAQEGDRSECYRDLLTQAVSALSFKDAYRIFIRIASDTNQDCHDFAHLFGRLTLAKYGRLPIDLEDQSFFICANGFWHGFMTAYTRVYKDTPQKIQQLCSSGREINDYEKNCYHGVGIGSVGDPPDIALWGNEQAIIAQAVATCESVTPTDFMRDECIGGVFHQIVDSKFAEEFHLPAFNQRDPLSFCDIQKREYDPMCIGQMAPRLHLFFEGNLEVVAHQLATHIPDRTMRAYMIALAVTGYVNSISEEEFPTVLSACGQLDREDRDACREGAFAGYRTRGISQESMESLTALSQAILQR